MILVLLVILFLNQRQINNLIQKNELLHAEIAINEAIRVERKKFSVSLTCENILIKENFGNNYKWWIDLEGLSYELGEDYILFRSEGDNSIMKSWFPRLYEGRNNGGFGNSVSNSEMEYKLFVSNNERVVSIGSYIKHLKKLCY